jgi:hypothetical protein
VAHIHGNRWYKARAEVWWDAAGEVGGGHRTADRRDNTTRQEGRTSTSTKPSEGVSDDACPQGPTTSTQHITTTPAQASPGRPKGAGTVGSMRSTTASTGPMCCGGPGQKYERMGGARASMASAWQRWSVKASQPFFSRERKTCGPGTTDRSRCCVSTSPSPTDGKDPWECRPCGIGSSSRRARS